MKPAQEIADEIMERFYTEFGYVSSENRRQVDLIARAIESARAEEREECAKLAEAIARRHAEAMNEKPEIYAEWKAAQAIRARAGERK